MLSSVWGCFAWKVQEISGGLTWEGKQQPGFAVGSHVQSRLGWTHTHTIKQLVTWTLTVSPCLTGLLLPTVVCSSSLGSFDNSLHSSTLLWAFTALKTFDMKGKMTARSETEEYWVCGKYRGIGNICRDATNPPPSPQVSQNKTEQILIRNRYLLGFCGWHSSSRGSPREGDESTVTFKKQSAVFSPFIHLGRFAWAPKPARPIKQHKQLFRATPASWKASSRCRRELIRPHAEHIWDSQRVSPVGVTCYHSCIFII